MCNGCPLMRLPEGLSSKIVALGKGWPLILAILMLQLNIQENKAVEVKELIPSIRFDTFAATFKKSL